MKKGIFPGSFDPLTSGHLDIIERGSALFDKLYIAVGVNSNKNYHFSLEQRIEMLSAVFEDNSSIEIVHYSGLTVDFCKELGTDYILRGLRNPADFEFEKSIAHTNKTIANIETVFLLTSADKSYISSSIVRDILRNNGDVSALVPQKVNEKIKSWN